MVAWVVVRTAFVAPPTLAPVVAAVAARTSPISSWLVSPVVLVAQMVWQATEQLAFRTVTVAVVVAPAQMHLELMAVRVTLVLLMVRLLDMGLVVGQVS
jgi:hypothetical protein